MSWVASAVAAGARRLTGVTVRWVGCRPEPRQRIYFANHTSHLDFVVLWSALPKNLRARTRPVAAKDYWNAGIRRRLAVDVFHAILVERKNKIAQDPPSTGGHALDLLIEAVNNGDSLIIFPEGTRGRGDEIAPFKSGIYHLWMRRPDIELVPVYLANLNRVLPRGEFLPVPFICRAVFGPPLMSVAGAAVDKESFLREAHEALCALENV